LRRFKLRGEGLREQQTVHPQRSERIDHRISTLHLLWIFISKTRASARPLKSLAFLIVRRTTNLSFGLNLMQEACYRFTRAAFSISLS
jgi:hypothetical protein